LSDVDCDLGDSTSSPHDVCALSMESATESRGTATLGLSGTCPDSRGPSRRAAEVYMGSSGKLNRHRPSRFIALHSCIAALSFPPTPPPWLHSLSTLIDSRKECHICGQHAAMPQRECRTSTSRDTCPVSGKATRSRTIMSIPEPAQLTRTLNVFSASLLNVLSIEDGTSHEDSFSPSAPML
jgi:hypothetical protein